jgi:hypothetical protein
MSLRISRPTNLSVFQSTSYEFAPQSLYTQTLSPTPNYWTDGFFSNNIAFFNNNNNTTGTLFQINDISGTPTFNFNSATDASDSAGSVFIENNRMFTWQGSTWFTCYDISNPFSPTVISRISGSFPIAGRLISPPQKSGNLLYLMGSIRYTVVDISNPSDMSSNVFLTVASDGVNAGDYNYARMLDNYFVYFNTRALPNQNTKIWSVNKSGKFPVLTKVLDTSANTTGFENGTYGSAFIGIIRNIPSDRFVMGGIDPSGNNAFRTFEISNNTVVPLSPFIKLQSIAFSSPGNCITIDNNLVYFVGNNGWMEVYDITNLSNPTLVTVLSIMPNVRAVQVSGNYSVIASRTGPPSLQRIRLNNFIPKYQIVKNTDIKNITSVKKIN